MSTKNTKRKQFQVQFPDHLSRDEQREALNKLNAAFDRQDIPASYEPVQWLVAYEETEESTQGNITFDAPSTNGERVIERWRKRNVPILLSVKHTLDKNGDFPDRQDLPSYCGGCIRDRLASDVDYGQVFPAFKAVSSEDCEDHNNDREEE